MVTGGNRGLGKKLCEHFAGHDYSRSNGHDITQDHTKLAESSLDYDVFVNNAFDGPFHESWANFGQIKLLDSVARHWMANKKNGWIINIGSVGSEQAIPPEPDFENYRVCKAALKFQSTQWSAAFKENKVLFRTSLLTLDRLDTEVSRSRPSWTGNGIALQDVANAIEYILTLQPNTCLSEIKLSVNFEHQI